MPEQPGSGRLDADLIASYLDGQLSPAERALVEASMAEDPEAYEWVVNAMRTADELEAAEPGTESGGDLGGEGGAGSGAGGSPPPLPDVPRAPHVLPMPPSRPPFHRRRTFQAVVGGVLATAAALLLVVRLDPAWWQQLTARDAVDPRMAGLVAAVGDERYIEGRLTGGFRYGPLRPVTRGPGDLSSQNLALLAAAAELQKAAQADPSADNLHAWGVAQVLLGEWDAGVDALRRALALSPSMERHSDLVAAMLAAAEGTGRSEDLPLALQEAEQVLRSYGEVPEALFSRAAVLESLGLRSAAAEAWRRYLVVDDTSEWAAEAGRRAERLEAAPGPGVRDDQDDRFDAAGGLRLLAERVVFSLPCLPGTPGMAAGRDVADPIARDALGMSWPDQVCEGYELLASGVARLDGDDLAGAREQFAGALMRFERAGHPFRYLARYHGAVASYLTRDYAAAEEQLGFLIDAARRLGSASLEAHAHWTLGLVMAATGRFRASLPVFSDALELADAAGEQVLYARLLNQLADVHEYLGDERAAWRQRVRAVAAAEQLPDWRLRHSVLGSLSTILMQRGLTDAADLLVRRHVQALGPDSPPVSRLTVLLRAQDLALARGDLVEAARIERAADEVLGVLSGDPRWHSLKGRQAVVRARRLVAAGDASAALREVETARAWLSTGRDLQLADALVTGVRARLVAGDTGGELAEVQHAVRLAVGRTGAGGTVFGSPEIRAVDAGVDALLESATLDAETSFRIMEEGLRLRSLGPRSSILDASLDEPDTLYLCYRVHGSTTSLWTVRQGTVTRAGLALARADAIGLVNQAWAATAGGDAAWARQILAQQWARLLGPVEEVLAGVGTLRIVADDPLDSLPFATLVDRRTGRRLVETHTIVIDAGVKRQPRKDWRRPESVAVFAPGAALSSDERLPPLPWSEIEAKQVGELYPRAVIRLGTGATADRLATDGLGVDVVHVAAHAVTDRADGRYSRLYLAAGDGQETLEGTALADVRWPPSSLLVLASCGSARADGRPSSPLHLANHARASGAAIVIATLGDVADHAAVMFFARLHALVRQGAWPPDALRLAQVEVLTGALLQDVEPRVRHVLWSSMIAVG